MRRIVHGFETIPSFVGIGVMLIFMSDLAGSYFVLAGQRCNSCRSDETYRQVK